MASKGLVMVFNGKQMYNYNSLVQRTEYQLTQFLTKKDPRTIQLWRLMNDCLGVKGYVSGGLISQLLYLNAKDGSQPPIISVHDYDLKDRDLDIFVRDTNVLDDLMKYFDYEYPTSKPNSDVFDDNDARTRYHRTDNSLTFINLGKDKLPVSNVQVITKHIGEPEQVGSTFDFLHCCSWFEPSQKKLYTHPSIVEAAVNKEFVPIQPLSKISRPRVQKLEQQGFKWTGIVDLSDLGKDVPPEAQVSRS